MTWIRREVSAIVALLVTVTAAQNFCDTSKAETVTASLLTGTVYPVLVTDERFGEGLEHYGGTLNPVNKYDGVYVSMSMYYTLPGSDITDCYQFTVECLITDNTCRYSDGLHFYVIAQADDYVALYTPRGDDLYTLEIYTTDFDRSSPVTVDDLPDQLLIDIKDRCGNKYTKQRAYPMQFPPGNFVPGCQSK